MKKFNNFNFLALVIVLFLGTNILQQRNDIQELKKQVSVLNEDAPNITTLQGDMNYQKYLTGVTKENVDRLFDNLWKNIDHFTKLDKQVDDLGQYISSYSTMMFDYNNEYNRRFNNLDNEVAKLRDMQNQLIGAQELTTKVLNEHEAAIKKQESQNVKENK